MCEESSSGVQDSQVCVKVWRCLRVFTSVDLLLLCVQTPGRGSPLLQGRAGSPVELIKGAPVRSATPPTGAVRVGVVSQASVQSVLAAPAHQSSSLPSLAAATAISPATVTFSQVRQFIKSVCSVLAFSFVGLLTQQGVQMVNQLLLLQEYLISFPCLESWNPLSYPLSIVLSLLPHLEESKINLNLIDNAPSLDIAPWMLSAPTDHFDLNKFKKGASNPEACKQLYLQTITKYSSSDFFLMVRNQARVAAAAVSTKHSRKPLSPSGQQLHIYSRIMSYSFGSKTCLLF